ncbi:MAG: cytochrome d ubiquinol oxidase subunit II [Alteromonadaceae bacterium]|nr:cytochrome d ubiquinol oxidase subunit II [Alteromonadaceae bacterium]
MIPDQMLPGIFAALMGIAILMYAILDGYDLGVGMLLPVDNESHRDTMIASIGPFWDANETWLVLAIGILLIAFPTAHSVVLQELYLPIMVMLIGLILRGVAFDFRAKVRQGRKQDWDMAFKVGSFMASAAQGFMLGLYVMGFEMSVASIWFAFLSAIGVVAAYMLIGATWLVMKTEGALQSQALKWAKKALRFCALGVLLVCAVNPVVSPDVMNKWLSGNGLLVMAVVPPLCALCFIQVWRSLGHSEVLSDVRCHRPFLYVLAIFVLCFVGLGFSFYPYVVPGQITIQESASAPESLRFILIGAMVVLPCIFAYTVFSYRVFRGKVTELRYY